MVSLARKCYVFYMRVGALGSRNAHCTEEKEKHTHAHIHIETRMHAHTHVRIA